MCYLTEKLQKIRLELERKLQEISRELKVDGKDKEMGNDKLEAYKRREIFL